MNSEEVKQLKQSKAQAQLVTHLQSFALQEEKKKCEGLEKKVKQLEKDIEHRDTTVANYVNALAGLEKRFSAVCAERDEYGEIIDSRAAMLEEKDGQIDHLRKEKRELTASLKNLRELLEELSGSLMEQRNQEVLDSFEPEVVIEEQEPRVIKPKKRAEPPGYRPARASEQEMLVRQIERFKRWKK